MNIAVRKVEIIEWLIQLKDEHLISKLEHLRQKSIKESYEARLKPMSTKAYKKMIEQSEKDFKQGRITTQEELQKEAESW